MIYSTVVQRPLLRSEKALQDKLLLLSNYSPNIAFIQEISVPDTKDKRVRSRRFDLVQHLVDKTRIFELKKARLSLEDVTSTLNKNYIHLAEEHFSKPVELVFISPIGIDKAAATLIAGLPNVFFILLKDLAGLLYDDYVSSLIPEAIWLRDRVKEEFQSIL